jgi:hypothetical protein
MDAALSEVSGAVDGQPLGVPRLEPYPQPGARDWILLLLDVSDPTREAEIQQDKAALADVASHAQQHHEIDVATFANRLQLLVPDHAGAPTPLEMLKTAPPQAAAADLGQVLDAAMAVPSLTPVDRRSIFVFTDGHSDDSVNIMSLVDSAHETGTSLNFIVSSSARQVDLPTLEALAKETGGVVVTKEKLADFLQAPFAFVDSGATARFPLDHLRRDSKADPNVTVAFRYGEHNLEISAPATNAARIEREALEQVLNSCESLCSEDFKKQIQSRIDLISAEEKTYQASGDDPNQLLEYAKECRVCSFRGEAEARAKSLKQQIVATTSSGPASSAMARMLQAELKRVGCDPITLDGTWNGLSERALARFNEQTHSSFDIKLASLEAIKAVRTKPDRVCPLACQAGSRVEAEKCVPIVCVRGFALGKGGSCERVAALTKQTTTLKPRSGSKSGSCVTIGVVSYCQ